MGNLAIWLWNYLAGKLPLASPAFWVNAISALSALLWATGLWQLAPIVAANFFAVVVCLNLGLDLLAYWIPGEVKQ